MPNAQPQGVAMISPLQELLNPAPIIQNLFASFLAVIFGIVFTYLVRRQWDKHKYGGWRVVVWKKGIKEVDRAISVEKAKEILHEPSELAVFLKGVASPYGWINCDILQKGVEEKLFVRDNAKLLFTIDLDRNPKPPPTITNEQIMESIQQLSQHMGVTLTRATSGSVGMTHKGESPHQTA
jgi:hypothetical protein